MASGCFASVTRQRPVLEGGTSIHCPATNICTPLAVN
jgi:hypothetical protein